MFVEIPKDGYWFKEQNIRKIEEIYNATYMGYWCTKRPDGSWNESPVDVFYVENPDTAKGHTNYFGMFRKVDPFTGHGEVYITEASSAFSEPLVGVICDDNSEVIISRFRHDYVVKKGAMVDGGRDYLRTNTKPTATVKVNGPNFVVEG